MRNIIIVTGGAGFIGSHLIEMLIKKTFYQIISLDNYSTGSKKNHIINKRVIYLKGYTKNFKLENVNPIFYNNEDMDDPIMVNFRGELKPLADLSLYDASSDKACIDFKNYTTNEIPIQYGKITGTKSFKP